MQMPQMGIKLVTFLLDDPCMLRIVTCPLAGGGGTVHQDSGLGYAKYCLGLIFVHHLRKLQLPVAVSICTVVAVKT